MQRSFHSSSEVFENLNRNLSEMAKRPPYHNRHVDLTVLRRIGPFIDGRGIILIISRKRNMSPKEHRMAQDQISGSAANAWG